MQQEPTERTLFRLDAREAAEVEQRIASGEPFAGSPDLVITDWLLTRTGVEVDEHAALLVIGDLRAQWRAAQERGVVPPQRDSGGPTDRALEFRGAIIVEELGVRTPLTIAWTDALIDLVTDDVPGAWFDRAVTTLAENPALPAECRASLVAASRRTDLSGFHPHMMGPDYALLLSRVPHRIAAHPAPMTADLLDVLLDGDVDDELAATLDERPDLTEEQRAAVAAVHR